MECILSLSYGKDSLACLGAIEELGWPLDRIVHAEVWATDTISADLPPMVEFKAKGMGCDVSEQAVMWEGQCMECDCAVALMNMLAVQAAELHVRLSKIEDILGNEYDLDRLKVIMNQRVSLKEEVAERWKLTGDISLDRLAEIVRAEKDGRLLTLDLNMLLSIGAGLHAIINNKKIHCAYYYTDLKKQFGGPYSIHFLDAVAILSDIFYPKQEMLKALKEGENNG